MMLSSASSSSSSSLSYHHRRCRRRRLRPSVVGWLNRRCRHHVQAYLAELYDTVTSDDVEGLDGDDLMLKDQMGIKAFPGIILFPFGPKQIKAAIVLDSNIAESMIDGEDGRRKAQKMLKNFLPSLVKSTATNAELNVFLHGSDHQLRRILLLTKLSKPSQMYKKLSLQFDRRFVFGISDSEDLARRFNRAVVLLRLKTAVIWV